MLTAAAYFDTSGHQASENPLVVVGLFSPERKWLAFEKRWRDDVLGLGVPYIHMKEFAPMIGPFEFLREHEPQRQAIVQAMIKVIKRSVNKIAAHCVSPTVFQEANKFYDIGSFWKGAYPLAAIGCVQQFRGWLTENHPGARMKWVFESGDAGWGRFQALMKAVKLEPIPLPKVDPDTGEWFAPFQAADFIAWEIAAEMKQQAMARRTRKPRRSALEMERMLPQLTFREFQMASFLAIAGKYTNVFPKRQTDINASSGASDA